jgi:threonine/homoserine/homoserine lactone efflux protein
VIPAANLLTFAVAAFVLIVIPGPCVLFVIGRSSALGRIGGLRSLLSLLGNALGIFTVVLAAAGDDRHRSCVAICTAQR